MTPGAVPLCPPVEPKPPSPRLDSGSIVTSWNNARSTRCITSCAILSPRLKLTGRSRSVFSRVTLISPRYPASTVPGAFTSVTPCLAARPERGCTNAAYPSGRAIAIPVRTRARSPGPSSTSSAAVRSAPASPGWAYDGSGTPGSRRWISTSGWDCGNGELPTGGTHGEDSATSGRCRILRAAGSWISPSRPALPLPPRLHQVNYPRVHARLPRTAPRTARLVAARRAECPHPRRHTLCRPGRALADHHHGRAPGRLCCLPDRLRPGRRRSGRQRSEEHTSELQSHVNLVCRLL